MRSGMFGVFFTFVFTIIIIGFTISAFLGYKCYTSGDPNSMACYMLSERHEIGIRNR